MIQELLKRTRHRSLLLSAMLGPLGSISSNNAMAAVTCTATATPSNSITNIVPWQNSTPVTGSISVKCRSGTFDWTNQISVSVCLSIGTGSGGTASDWQPRKMKFNGTSSPLMDFYINQQDGSFFGSIFNTTPVVIPRISMQGYGGSSSEFVVPMQFLVSQQTTVVPGTYSSDFSSGHTLMVVSASVTGNGNPPSCLNSQNSTSYFPFTVTANVPAFCEVSGNTPMQFPEVAGFGDTARSALTNVVVRCTSSTSYRINLTPSNNDGAGKGNMKLLSGGTDSVGYSLYQDSSRTLPWGNLPANSVSGSGTGTERTFSVYGLVPANLNATPGDYSDSVQITVTY